MGGGACDGSQLEMEGGALPIGGIACGVVVFVGMVARGLIFGGFSVFFFELEKLRAVLFRLGNTPFPLVLLKLDSCHSNVWCFCLDFMRHNIFACVAN